MENPMGTTKIPTTAMDSSAVQMGSRIKCTVRITGSSTRKQADVNATSLAFQVV